jgi:non-canonical poly(A) RNA polymerase PAPD5/7
LVFSISFIYSGLADEIGKLNVDISLNQTNGITAGNIVNQYLDVLPGCRQLILVVKAFLSQRSMNEVYTGGLGSYAVICLVISFLQVSHTLHSPILLVETKQLHPKLRRGDIDPEENLGTLLVEFFELYGRNYSFDEVGISIRRGGSYFSKKSRGWYNSQRPFLLSIEDPQDRGKLSPVLMRDLAE